MWSAMEKDRCWAPEGGKGRTSSILEKSTRGGAGIMAIDIDMAGMRTRA
jgi:hypothetical protein